MMKQINLVPIAVRQKAATRREVPTYILAGVLGAGLAGAAWFGFSIQINALNAQHTDNVQHIQAEVAKLAKEQAATTASGDLQSRVTVLNTLAQSDIDWHKALAYVASLTPKDITLSAYSFATAQGTITLKMTGNAPSNVSYATFAEFLKSTVGKQTVSYKIEGYTYSPATGGVTFTITIIVPSDKIRFSTAPTK